MEQKLRLVAETREPGARVRSVAVRHGVCESLLFTWRRQADDGVLASPEVPVFVPVQVLEPVQASAGLSRPEPRPAPSGPVPSARPQQGLIEIELGGDRRVRVGSDVDLAALRRVLVALRA